MQFPTGHPRFYPGTWNAVGPVPQLSDWLSPCHPGLQVTGGVGLLGGNGPLRGLGALAVTLPLPGAVDSGIWFGSSGPWLRLWAPALLSGGAEPGPRGLSVSADVAEAPSVGADRKAWGLRLQQLKARVRVLARSQGLGEKGAAQRGSVTAPSSRGHRDSARRPHQALGSGIPLTTSWKAVNQAPSDCLSCGSCHSVANDSPLTWTAGKTRQGRPGAQVAD